MSLSTTAGEMIFKIYFVAEEAEVFIQTQDSQPAQDHAHTVSRALRASISHLPGDWCHQRGQLCQSWLRTVEADLNPLNFGLHSACRHAADRSAWQSLVETAMPFLTVAPPLDDDNESIPGI